MSRAVEQNEQEEALAIGRLLGKANKDVLKTLEQLSKQKRKKKSEIVKEAIEFYEKLQTLDGLDAKTLFAGFMFWKEVMQMGVEFLASLSPIFSTNLVQSQLALLSQFMQKQQTQEEQTHQIEEDPYKATLEQMRMNLLQQIMNIILNMISGLQFPGQTQLGGLNKPKTTLTDLVNQQKQTSNIPVEIIE